MQMLLKSCLKSVGGAAKREASSSARPAIRRNVSFRGQDADEVHAADDWDRSPVDVTSKLTYDDILELKEMQIAAARACARAQAASGLPSTSRYLSNVPVALLPLLAESPSTQSPPSPSSTPGLSGVLASPLLSEACLCKIFSADTGVRTSSSTYFCPLHSSTSSPPRTQSSPSSNTSNMKVNTQIPSPPDTPPRPLITPMPPPRRARMFSFLPLLETPTTTPEVTPTTSGVTSPAMSPSASDSSIYSSSANSSQYANSGPGPSSSAAYGAYGAYITDNQRQTGFGYAGVGGSGTLGLERKLGFGFEESSESEASGSESEKDLQDEDDDWPKDWPGKRVHVLHRTSHSKAHGHPSFSGDEHSRSNSDEHIMPPSPPMEDSTSRTASIQNHNPYFPPIPSTSASQSQSSRLTSPSSRHSSLPSPNRANRPTSLSTTSLNSTRVSTSYPPSPPSPSLSSSTFNVSSSPLVSSPRSPSSSPRPRQTPGRTQSPAFSHSSPAGQRRTSPSASPVANEGKMALLMLA